MAATRLPLELQQQVFTFLDTKSFHAARKVCNWWRYASNDPVMLARQLKKLPILPPAHARASSPTDLQRLFSEAAYILLLGTQVSRAPDMPGSLSPAYRHGFEATPRVCATSRGDRTVTLNERTIALFDTSSTQWEVLAQRPLNDLKESVGNGPWLKPTPTSYHELALSSNGSLLAIAQERTIQIYDLMAESDSFTVNAYVSSAAGHYICGLDFEQEDHVLRVRLSGKGTILYMGTPPVDSKSVAKADMQHWKSEAGLRHTFLDSSKLLLSNGETAGDRTARLSGVQLLRPALQGYLFAAQRHGGSQSSHYVLGHFETSVPLNAPALTAEPGNVTILAKLESFLSSWEYTLNSSGNDNGMGVWENMPSAHEHHSRFALSEDGSLLALAERDKKSIRPTPLTQLFVYRLPGARKVQRMIKQKESDNVGQWATLASFLDKLEQRSQRKKSISSKQEDFEMTKPPKTFEVEHRVGRIPLCLSTIQGDVTEMMFVSKPDAEPQAYTLSACTAEATKTWKLVDF